MEKASICYLYLAFVIALGIIIDDAIIVSENFSRHREMGKSAKQAALDGSVEVMPPVIATIITSITAFGAMLVMSGVFGKFTFSVPFIIIVCLLASLFKSFIILPSHLYDMNYSVRPNVNKAKRFARFRDTVYKPILTFSLNHKILMLTGLLILFVLSLVLQTSLGRFKLFPADVETFSVRLEADSGTSKKEVNRFVQAVATEVAKIPNSELDSFIGRAGIQSRSELDPTMRRGEHLGMLEGFLQPIADRKFSSNTITNWLRKQTAYLVQPKEIAAKPKSEDKQVSLEESEFLQLVGSKTQIPSAFSDLKGKLVSLQIEGQQSGLPVGKPVAIEIIGKDYATLRQIANEYEALLSQIEGVYDIENDYLLGKEELHIKVNETLAARVGVSVFDIATAVNTGFEGTIATSIQRSDEEVDVRVRFAEKYRKGQNAIREIKRVNRNNQSTVVSKEHILDDWFVIVNQKNQLIPVAPLVNLTKSKNIRSINHLNGKRVLTITANIDANLVTSTEVTNKVFAMAKAIPPNYPQYTIQAS